MLDLESEALTDAKLTSKTNLQSCFSFRFMRVSLQSMQNVAILIFFTVIQYGYRKTQNRTRGRRDDLCGDEMGAVAQVGGIHAVGQPRHAPGQLARDLDVVPLQPVQRAHPEARAHLEERELPLGERPDGAGQEAAASGPAV